MTYKYSCLTVFLFLCVGIYTQNLFAENAQLKLETTIAGNLRHDLSKTNALMDLEDVQVDLMLSPNSGKDLKDFDEQQLPAFLSKALLAMGSKVDEMRVTLSYSRSPSEETRRLVDSIVSGSFSAVPLRIIFAERPNKSLPSPQNAISEQKNLPGFRSSLWFVYSFAALCLMAGFLFFSILFTSLKNRSLKKAQKPNWKKRTPQVSSEDLSNALSKYAKEKMLQLEITLKREPEVVKKAYSDLSGKQKQAIQALLTHVNYSLMLRMRDELGMLYGYSPNETPQELPVGAWRVFGDFLDAIEVELSPKSINKSFSNIENTNNSIKVSYRSPLFAMNAWSIERLNKFLDSLEEHDLALMWIYSAGKEPHVAEKVNEHLIRTGQKASVMMRAIEHRKFADAQQIEEDFELIQRRLETLA